MVSLFSSANRVGSPEPGKNRYTLDVDYETTLSIYPKTVTDSFKLTSTSTYSLLFGKPTRQEDVNGAVRW